MSLISRLHHVLEGGVKDRFVELKTTTPMEELRRVANLENIILDRLKFVERLEDGEYGLLDMEENIFYRTAKDVERGFETYSGTTMTFEDPEIKKWLVANIGGERGITNSAYGKVGVRGIAGEVTYEQALAVEDVSIPRNKNIRRFNELVYFKNLKRFTFSESSIEEISLPYLSIDVTGPFYACTRLKKLTTKYGLDVRGSSFISDCNSLVDLDTSNWTLSGSSTESMFNNCTSLQSLDTSKWNLGNLSNGQAMFNNCTSLQSLDTSKWNLGNLSNGQAMFSNCTSLQSLDTSKWNLSNLNTANSMFRETKINTLDVRGWDLRKLTNAAFMFYQTPLISLDTSGWVLSSLSNADQMFKNCSHLITLENTSRWGLERLTNAMAMFRQCRSLQSLDTSGWNLENVTTTRQMFDTCMALTTLGNTSRWNLIRCTDMQNLLINCNQLTKVDLTYTSTPQVVVSDLVGTLHSGSIESIVGDHTETDNVSVWNGFNSDSLDLDNFTRLNLASFLAIFRGVGTNRVRRRISLPNSIKSRIPQEYKTMLENKNWELR